MPASKNARRRKRSKAKGRRHAATSSAGDALPRPVRLIQESYEELAFYLENAPDQESAATLAHQRMADAVARIMSGMAGHDSLDVAENAAIANFVVDPETYAETEHEGNSTVVELVALIACSQSVIAASQPPGGYDLGAQPPMAEILSAAQELTDDMGMWRMFQSADHDHSGAELSFLLTLRETNVRSTSYPHMLRDTLEEVIGDDSTDASLQTLAGFGSHELLAVADELVTYRETRWRARMSRYGDFLALAQTWSLKSPPDDASHQAEAAARALWENPSESGVIEPEVVATATGLAAEKVERILEFLSCDVSGPSAIELVEDFSRGANPLRARPLLRHPSGRRFLPNHMLVLPAIRRRVEETLKAHKQFDAYVAHRAAVVEAIALRWLGLIFPTATIHDAFKYFVPDPGKPDEREPAHYTKRVEGDGLLVVDDVAIVVEVKSGALTEASQSGNATGLLRDLRKLITEGADQAARTRERILDDGGLRLLDNTWLDLSAVREVHTVVVTLEDLSGIMTVTENLVKAGLLPTENLPFTVSLDDLRIMSEVIDRPAEFLLYLRRRTLPETTRYFLAADEIDFFLYMLRKGLYVEPDPELKVAQLPFSEPKTAHPRKFAAQRRQWITSETVPLDSWYAFERGERQTPAAKPRFEGNAEMLALVDLITERGQRGWLATTTLLLSADAQLQRTFGRIGRQTADKIRVDQRPHTVTFVLGDRARTAMVLAWVACPAGLTTADLDMFAVRYGDYIAAKRHQMKLPRGALIMVDHKGRYLRLLFDNDPVEDRPDLDALGASIGLKSPMQMPSTTPRSARQPKRRKR